MCRARWLSQNRHRRQKSALVLVPRRRFTRDHRKSVFGPVGHEAGVLGNRNAPPSDLTNVVTLAAHENGNLAIKSDGTLVAWPDRTVTSGLRGVFAIAPSNLANLVLVSAAPPSLHAQLSGRNFILTWPIRAQNFNLQAATNLADPNSWTGVPDLPALINGQYVVTTQIFGGSRFYRLSEQ